MNTPRWPKTFREEMAARPLYAPVKTATGFHAEADPTGGLLRIDAQTYPTLTACEVRCADLNCGCNSLARPTFEDTEGDWKRWHATWCPCNRAKTVAGYGILENRDADH